MAKRRGQLTDRQRERARRLRLEEQARRARAQAELKAQRERQRAERAAAQKAAATERERKRLYVEGRKAEAAEMTADVAETIKTLDSVLIAGIGQQISVTFSSLRRTYDAPPFDPGGLDQPDPRPSWAQFAPRPPGMFGRLLGGDARYEQKEAEQRRLYEQACAEYDTRDAERHRRLDERYRAHQQRIAQEKAQVDRHNGEIDEFERAVRAGEPEPVAQYFTMALDASVYPDDFPHQTRAIYRPEARELVVDYELPPLKVVPTVRGYKYVQTRDEMDAIPASKKEIDARYARLIAQVAIRTLHEIFIADPAELVTVATFKGRVSIKDKATGLPERPYLIDVSAERELFSTFVLADLDPVYTLKKLNALVSPHPYDLEAVRPVVDFEALLAQYKFVEGIDAMAGLDSRRDLLGLSPAEFEHFVRQLFEAMGMKSWVTQASRDDGVDAVAINEDPMFGGLCIIQAKRYSKAVGIEAVRALAGVMEDKRATKGILVTTSWVGTDSRDFAARHGRMQIIECEELKYLCREYLDLDVLISLPKAPPKRS
ncbi:restriction endonuclease [Nonomuraea sp. NPDC049784]|uniref:restriction endonuclease n=1 Tax=Nonomuraea sp. NPDC049784 TaxID=3154361 RepID=UPI00340C8F10